MHRHPNIAAWQREEDGSYASEVEGWSLHVAWRPEGSDPELRRGFLWKVTSPEGDAVEATDVEEEIEMAMALAEDVVRLRRFS